MFFSKIYKSWKKTQFKKYEEIINTVGKNFFNGLILDIGCGPLYFEEFLKKNGIKAKMISIDIDKATLIKSRANTKLNISTIIADGNFLPFLDNSFDTIISFDTMHLIKNIDFKNVLKKKGFVLFSLFFNETNKEEKKRLLKEKLAGFKTIKEFEILGKENEYIVVARK